MSQPESKTVRLKVSPQVSRIVKKGAPRDAQLAAARGALPLSGKDLLTALFFLCNGQDAEIKREAVRTLKGVPASILSPVLDDSELHPHLLDLLVRGRLGDADLMGGVIVHPSVRKETLIYLAKKGSGDVLERLAANHSALVTYPELVELIIANPAAERALKFRLGWQDPEEVKPEEEPEAKTSESSDATAPDVDEVDEEKLQETLEEAEQEGLSKYQIAMTLTVSEKIKMAFTGDKEWRTLLMKDSNKLVQGAVMKNPRISDGEVMMVAKNKTSSDDLIRLILLNKDWMKLYEVKRALATHPKTPMPKAIRMVALLSTKDVKDLMRSKNVSTIISTTARKEFEKRQKRGGG